MGNYTHMTRSEMEVNEAKPGTRWEISPRLDIPDYNFNIARLDPGEWLSENGFHYHENQREFFYMIEGECQVETETESFELAADSMVYFEEGVPHLLHNASATRCELIAIGSPPEGRYPVHEVVPAEEYLSR